MVNPKDRFPHDKAQMSHMTRKPVFGVWELVRLKPVCSATDTSKGLEISAIASTGIILSRQQTTNALDQTVHMRRLMCDFVVRIWHKQVFS